MINENKTEYTITLEDNHGHKITMKVSEEVRSEMKQFHNVCVLEETFLAVKDEFMRELEILKKYQDKK